MAFTKVVGAGIHTLAQLETHNIHSAGIVTATKFVGEMESGGGSSTFQNVTVSGNLTVQGDTTTLNTTLRNVELLRVATNSNTTAGIITQTGSGDILNLFDATTEVMTVLDGGNVGIGITNPSEKLDVNGTIQCLNELRSKTGNDLLLNAGSANRDVKIQVNDANMLYVKGDTGNIGIGTDTPVGNLEVRDSSKTNLIVAKSELPVKSNSDISTTYDMIQLGAGGALASYSATSVTADTMFIHNAYRHSGNDWKRRYADTAARMRVNSPANTWIFETAATGSADSTITSWDESLRITSAGRLGIGIQTPTKLLDIAADTSADGIRIKSTGNTYNELSFDSNRSAKDTHIGRVISYWNGTAVSYISMDSGDAAGSGKNKGYMRFWTADGSGNFERLRITSAGAVVTGGTTAQASDAVTLMPDGEVTAAGFYFSNNIGSPMNSDGIRRHTTGTICIDTGSQERLRIASDGHVAIGGYGDPGSILDVREDKDGAETMIRLWNTDHGDTTTQTAAFYMSPDSRGNATTGLRALKENASFATNAGRDISLSLNVTQNNSQVEGLRITSAGNVGIGIINPTNKLEISGGLVRCLGSTSARFTANNGSAEGFVGWNSGTFHIGEAAATTQIAAAGANIISMVTNSVERLRIHSDGEVEIKPSVAGQTTLSVQALWANASRVHIATFGRNGNDVKSAITYNHGTNIIEFGTTTNHATSFVTNNIERIRITSGGSLQVKGDANPNAVFDRGSANTTNVNFNYNGTLTGQLGAANQEFQISAAGASTPLVAYVNGDERLRIDTTGRLLIGTQKTYSSATWYDDITINNSNGTAQTGGTGITLISSPDSWNSIYFGDSDDNGIGGIKYDHNTNHMRFVVNGVDPAVHIDSSSRVGLNGLLASSYYSTYSNLVLGKTNDSAGMTIVSGTSHSGYLTFADGTSSADQYRGRIFYDHSSNAFKFRCNGLTNDIFTIDSSQTYITSTTTDGVLNLDTSASNGTFIRFKQGGTTKHWIGCATGLGGHGDNDDLALRATDNIKFMTTTSNVVGNFDSNGAFTTPKTPAFKVTGHTNTWTHLNVAAWWAFDNGSNGANPRCDANWHWHNKGFNYGGASNNGCFSTTTGRFTAPVAGHYYFWYIYYMQRDPGNTDQSSYIHVNPCVNAANYGGNASTGIMDDYTLHGRTNNYASQNNLNGVTGSWGGWLAAGDTFEFKTYNSNNTNGYNIYFGHSAWGGWLNG